MEPIDLVVINNIEDIFNATRQSGQFLLAENFIPELRYVSTEIRTSDIITLTTTVGLDDLNYNAVKLWNFCINNGYTTLKFDSKGDCIFSKKGHRYTLTCSGDSVTLQYEEELKSSMHRFEQGCNFFAEILNDILLKTLPKVYTTRPQKEFFQHVIEYEQDRSDEVSDLISAVREFLREDRDTVDDIISAVEEFLLEEATGINAVMPDSPDDAALYSDPMVEQYLDEIIQNGINPSQLCERIKKKLNIKGKDALVLTTMVHFISYRALNGSSLGCGGMHLVAYGIFPGNNDDKYSPVHDERYSVLMGHMLTYLEKGKKEDFEAFIKALFTHPRSGLDTLYDKAEQYVRDHPI